MNCRGSRSRTSPPLRRPPKRSPPASRASSSRRAATAWRADRAGEAPVTLPALPVRLVSTHGAGDAFVGALVASLASGDAFRRQPRAGRTKRRRGTFRAESVKLSQLPLRPAITETATGLAGCLLRRVRGRRAAVPRGPGRHGPTGAAQIARRGPRARRRGPPRPRVPPRCCGDDLEAEAAGHATAASATGVSRHSRTRPGRARRGRQAPGHVDGSPSVPERTVPDGVAHQLVHRHADRQSLTHAQG